MDFVKKKNGTTGGIDWVIAGLGNPGKRYERTRHNIGFRAIELLTERTGAGTPRARFDALCAQGILGDQRVLLLRPQTMMNASGIAIESAMNYYRLPPERLIVIYDDVSLDVGRMRVRPSGSAGGHNGMKDIITCLGTDIFARIRIGVGQKPSPEYDLAGWVLGTFSSQDEKLLPDMLFRASEAAELICMGKLDQAMNQFNRSFD